MTVWAYPFGLEISDNLRCILAWDDMTCSLYGCTSLGICQVRWYKVYCRLRLIRIDSLSLGVYFIRWSYLKWMLISVCIILHGSVVVPFQNFNILAITVEQVFDCVKYVTLIYLGSFMLNFSIIISFWTHLLCSENRFFSVQKHRFSHSCLRLWCSWWVVGPTLMVAPTSFYLEHMMIVRSCKEKSPNSFLERWVNLLWKVSGL